MAVRPTTLALENLESRLNLSTLLGQQVPTAASNLNFSQERARFSGSTRMISLSKSGASRQALAKSPLTAAGSSLNPAPDLNATSTTKTISLSWSNNSANATGFHIERSSDGGATFTVIATVGVNRTSYVDAKVTYGVTYTYEVTAFNKYPGSSASGRVSIALQTPAAPSMPTQVGQSKATLNSISLAWKDNATNESGYHVYRSTDGVNYALVGSTGVNGRTFTDSGVEPGTTYDYKIAAWNAGGETEGMPVTGTSLTPPPAVPGNVTTSSLTGSGVTLSWTESSANVSGFRVYRSTNGKTFTLVGNLSATATSFTDSGLASTTKYSYEVSAWNARGSATSKPVTATTLAAAPNSPTALGFTDVTTSSVTLEWADNSSNENGFQVYRSADGATYSLIATAGANTTTFTDGNLDAGSTYWYEVSAYNVGGSSGVAGGDVTLASNPTPIAEGPVVAAPSAPSSLDFSSVTTNSTTLRWDAASGETGYHVYQSTDGVNFSLVSTLGTDATSWTNSGLLANTTYTYKVGAFNDGGESMTGSASVSTLVAVPNAPTNVAFTNVTSSSVTLNWVAPGAQSGYHVYRSTDGVNYTLVGTLDASATSWTNAGLASNTGYAYKVGAYNSAGEATSATATTSTLVVAPNAPGAVSFTSVTTSGVTLNWSAPGNQTGYHVYRSTAGGSYTLVGTLAASATSWSDSSLSSSTAYSYIVGAYNNGGETQGAAASVTTATPVVNNPVSVATKNMTSFTELVITGTTSNDSILVTQSNGTLYVTANGQTLSYANSFGDMKIYGVSGNDTITVDSSVNIATLVYGGDGSDVIKNQTTGKATIVTIGNGTNTVTGNGVNTAYWVNSGDTVNSTSAEVALGGVNRVGTFYQPFTTTTTAANYVPRTLYGQNLTDPTDSGSEKRLTNSSFWGTGPTMNDINQTGLADCYYLAPLASLAYSEPQKLMNMGVDLGDGTYAVRFVRNGVTSYVRVDADLSTGYWNYGLANQTPGTSGDEWASIFEKAYAYFRTGGNTYSSLNYGSQAQTYSDLGLSNRAVSPSSTSAANTLSLINTQLSASHGMAASTITSIQGGAPLIGSHVYTIIGAYQNSSGTVMVQLRNPWGVDGAGNDGNTSDAIVTIDYATFIANFNSLNYTTV